MILNVDAKVHFHRTCMWTYVFLKKINGVSSCQFAGIGTGPLRGLNIKLTSAIRTKISHHTSFSRNNNSAWYNTWMYKVINPCYFTCTKQTSLFSIGLTRCICSWYTLICTQLIQRYVWLYLQYCSWHRPKTILHVVFIRYKMNCLFDLWMIKL